MPLSFSLKSSAKDDGNSNNASMKKTNVNAFNAFATTTTKKPTLKKNAFAAFTSTTSKKEDAEAPPQTKRRRVDPKLPDASSSIYDFDGWKQSDEGKNQKQRRGRRLGAKRKYGVVYGGGERGGNQDGDKKSKPKSRYVENLLVKANARKREQNIAYERAKQRELEAEIAEHGQTETFVTGAYKRKLQEDKIWMEKLEDRRREEEERDRKDRETDSRGDMTSFYRNLLTRNVALGGEDEDEKSVDDVKSNARVVERTPKEETKNSEVVEEVDTTKKSPPPTSVSVERPRPVSEPPIPRKETTKQVEVPPVVVSPPTTTAPPAPKISKEDRIAAARARYLARRKVKK